MSLEERPGHVSLPWDNSDGPHPLQGSHWISPNIVRLTSLFEVFLCPIHFLPLPFTDADVWSVPYTPNSISFSASTDPNLWQHFSDEGMEEHSYLTRKYQKRDFSQGVWLPNPYFSDILLYCQPYVRDFGFFPSKTSISLKSSSFRAVSKDWGGLRQLFHCPYLSYSIWFRYQIALWIFF